MTEPGGDLMVRGGAVVLGGTDLRNIELIVEGCAGDFKGAPVLGAGLERYLKGVSNVEVIKRAVGVHLESDGYVIEGIEMVDNRLIIDVK